MVRSLPREPRKGARRGGGSYPCAVCDHEEHEQIDQALVSRVPLRVLSKRYGMSTASLSRHHSRHVSRSLVVVQLPHPSTDRSPAARLENTVRRLEVFVEQAEATGQGGPFLLGIRELRATVESLARVVSDQPAAAVDVLRSEEWAVIRTAITKALEPHPKARVDVARALAALDGGKGPG